MKSFLTIALLAMITLGSAQTENQLLKKAYKKKSPELLAQFFETWKQEIPPISEVELSQLNDTLRQAYGVFKGFYKPQSIDSLGGSEWGNDIYKDVPYLAVQDFVEIYITEDKIHYTEKEIEELTIANINELVKEDSVKEKLLQRADGKLLPFVIENFGADFNAPLGSYDVIVDSIVNFRPNISAPGKEPLYLTSKYAKILRRFLGKNKRGVKKQAFLANSLKIWQGHWGGYWQIHSYPLAFSITFDKEMKHAKVNFRMVYEGGEAILKHENGKWQLVSAKRTWIE